MKAMLAAAVLAADLGFAVVVHADSDPARLIEAMSSALQTLNYEGTFIHVRAGHVESLHIVHTNDGKGEYERMISLNGDPRQVIRTRNRVTCIWPGSQSVVVTRSKPRSALPKIDASLPGNSQYELSLGQIDRVAGIDTRIVRIRPRDRYRYGYRLWIDRETRMLLRSMLLDADQRVLEEVMFTTIDYPEHIPLERFDVRIDEGDISWSEPLADYTRDSGGDGGRKRSGKTTDRVDFDELPTGYREVSETYRSMPINDGPVSHVMLSDGVASVSVYVEYVAADAHDSGTLGLSSMGAMNAFGVSLPNAQVTAVGEVPSITVEAIARAVTLNP